MWIFFMNMFFLLNDPIINGIYLVELALKIDNSIIYSVGFYLKNTSRSITIIFSTDLVDIS